VRRCPGPRRFANRFDHLGDGPTLSPRRHQPAPWPTRGGIRRSHAQWLDHPGAPGGTPRACFAGATYYGRHRGLEWSPAGKRRGYAGVRPLQPRVGRARRPQILEALRGPRRREVHAPLAKKEKDKKSTHLRDPLNWGLEHNPTQARRRWLVEPREFPSRTRAPPAARRELLRYQVARCGARAAPLWAWELWNGCRHHPASSSDDDAADRWHPRYGPADRARLDAAPHPITTDYRFNPAPRSSARPPLRRCPRSPFTQLHT